MTVSDQLTKLAAKAKEAEDNIAAARAKDKAALEEDVRAARDEAQAQADALRKNAESTKSEIAAWWAGVQRSWDEHLAAVRKAWQDRKAEHDADAAQRAAERADDNASFALDYAYAAIEEAEYAVLDAQLAHLEADELAKT